MGPTPDNRTYRPPSPPALLWRLVGLLMGLLLGNGASANEPLTYNFVKFAPFQYVDEQTGKAEGVTLDLLRAAAAEIDQPLTLQQLPQNRMIQMTRAGRLPLAFVSSFYMAPTRDLYHCSAPLTSLRPSVYVNRAQYPDIDSLDKLANQVVYAPQSTSHTLMQLLPRTVKTDDSHPDRAIVRMFAKSRLGIVVDFQEHMAPPLVALSPNFPYRRLDLPTLDIILCINPAIAHYQARHQALEQAVLRVATSQAGAEIFAKHSMFLKMRAPGAGPEVPPEPGVAVPQSTSP